ncbi:MAG: hypothetical protein MUP68_08030 [Deltaproteobacteria bacterium]|nr:hypothetical protein [Deltaproteobacteria bacterium]
MAKPPESGSTGFVFRDLPRNILIGTASDRYAGWIGQDSKKRMAHGAWGMEHSVRTTQPGVLYLTELVNLVAAAAEAVCQGEGRGG